MGLFHADYSIILPSFLQAKNVWGFFLSFYNYTSLPDILGFGLNYLKCAH